MTQTKKSVNIIDRTEIKRTGVILYEILSSNGIDKYFATVKDGEVSCECKGFEFRGTCRHAQYIAQVELNGSFDIQSAADELVESAENAALDSFYAERGAEMVQYGVCGHLSKNPDDECGACRSRWYR